MTKTEVVSNVCLVCINTDGECMHSLNRIENAMLSSKLCPLFLSAANIFGNCEKIYVAVNESDIFLLMNILGSIRKEAQIKNYSINCSNCMIKWQSESVKPIQILQRANCDIKLVLSLSDEGICFCDNAYHRRICSLLSGSDRQVQKNSKFTSQ